MYWYWGALLCLVLVVPGEAVVRLHCSKLVTERLDPLVSPGLTPSSHVHQIVGGVRPNLLSPLLPPLLTHPTEFLQRNNVTHQRHAGGIHMHELPIH